MKPELVNQSSLFSDLHLTAHPYRLNDVTAKLLSGIASETCFRCRGRGVSKWKKRGYQAEICQCVKKRIPALEMALESQKERLEAEIEDAKRKDQGDVHVYQGELTTVAQVEAPSEG